VIAGFGGAISTARNIKTTKGMGMVVNTERARMSYEIANNVQVVYST
jgi:hypothetical protein